MLLYKLITDLDLAGVMYFGLASFTPFFKVAAVMWRLSELLGKVLIYHCESLFGTCHIIGLDKRLSHPLIAAVTVLSHCSCYSSLTEF